MKLIHSYDAYRLESEGIKYPPEDSFLDNIGYDDENKELEYLLDVFQRVYKHECESLRECQKAKGGYLNEPEHPEYFENGVFEQRLCNVCMLENLAKAIGFNLYRYRS